MRDTFAKVVTGIIGTVTPAAGTAVSMLDQVEAWLRIVSLLIGIAVGIVSYRSIRRRDRAK